MLVHIKALGRDVLALEVNFAGGGLLQEVQASDKGGLTAARGTDDDDHVALADGLAQPVEDGQAGELFQRLNMKAIRQPRIEPQNTVSREMRMVVRVPRRKY